MKTISATRIKRIMLMFSLSGIVFLTAQVGFAQDDNDRSALGAIRRMAGFDKFRGPARKKKSPKKREDSDCVGNLKVNIAASHSIVQIGKPYTFVAHSHGGCKGTYKYMWSGTNLNTGNRKQTRLLNRNYMTAAFKNPGISTISVAVVDAKNNKASDRVAVKVLAKK